MDRSSRNRRSTRALAAAVLLLCGVQAAVASSWTGLRGPSFDGSAADALPFGEDGGSLSLGWKQPLGSGYSGAVVADGRVYTMFASEDADVAAAFDAATGEELWRYRIGDRHAGFDGSHDGPISTPLVAGGRLYGFDARGKLFALDAATGAEVWAIDVEADLGGKKPYYGFSTSPLMQDGVLVVEIGAGEGKAVAGFDPADGTMRWSVGDDEIHYHSPVVARLGGRPVVLAAGSKTLLGIDAASGATLFAHEHGGDDRAMGGATIVPVPAGDDRVFVMNKIDSSAMLRIRPGGGGTWSIEELWSNNAIKSSYVVPAYHDGHLYGMNNRIFTCVDAETGEMKWRSREPGDGFPTVVGDHLVVITKPGTLHVALASSEAYREIARLDLFEDHSWATVAVADGKLYARSMGEIARVDPTGSMAAEDDGSGWIAATAFGRFVADVEAADDKAAVVDAYLEAQSAFPIVEDGGVVHFVWRGDDPDVGIVGDMIGYRREDPMTRVPGTDLFHYSTRLEPDAAVTYGFLPAFAEAPVADPRNPAVGKGLFGDVSWFAMPAWPAPSYVGEAEAGRQGRLETVTWTSEVGEEPQDRTAQVYLPAGYDAEPERRYPVVYVHDGKTALEEGALKNTLDWLIGESVRPSIAVFVHPLDPDNARADFRDPEAYGRLIADELVTEIDGRFRTIAEPGARANVGAAGAGSAALMLTFARADRFGRVGVLDPILEPPEVEAVLPETTDRLPVIWLGWGTYHLRSPHEAWDFAVYTRGVRDLLRERGYRPTGGERAEGFGWACWQARTGEMLRALFPN